MKNIERQKSLDKKKWLESERLYFDCSGLMDYCSYCDYEKGWFCSATQEEREEKCLCATAYNRLVRYGKKF